MSNVEKLIALGAQPVGGDLIWKHKVLGHFRHGEFLMTPEGEAALSIEDVEFTEVPAPAAPKPAAKKAKKAEPEAPAIAPVDVPAPAAPTDLDDLLG